MRSIYARILLASIGTVLLSLAAFLVIYFRISMPARQRLIHAFEDVLTDDAAALYAREGPSAVAGYLARVDAAAPPMTRYLLDSAGRDVVTGADRSALLGQAQDSQGRDVFVHHSTDGRYTLVILAVPPVSVPEFAPYFALILGAVAFVCWLLAIGIASPVREMVTVVNQFGRGQLSARASMTRRDDIGELARSFNQMADRIETLVTAERRLISDVSHELRSPLTRLNMAIELSRTATDREGAVDRLQREADRLSHLVGTLLEVTRLEGDPALAPADMVDVPAVVRTVAAACELEAHSRDCHIAVEGGGDTKATGSAELLRRAFENVLRNAIRYAPPGTAIELRCEQKGADVLVSIRDFGPGVPDEALPHLGSPFYRVDASRDTSTGGLGLGLAIARRAVQLHHGTWSVENAHPGLRVVMNIPAASRTT
jgi:signal transduction histidine kinase